MTGSGNTSDGMIDSWLTACPKQMQIQNWKTEVMVFLKAGSLKVHLKSSLIFFIIVNRLDLFHFMLSIVYVLLCR